MTKMVFIFVTSLLKKLASINFGKLFFPESHMYSELKNGNIAFVAIFWGYNHRMTGLYVGKTSLNFFCYRVISCIILMRNCILLTGTASTVVRALDA